MAISRKEAEESLEMIENLSKKTKLSIANGGAHFLILWGIIWFFGFTANQFINSSLSGYIWLGLTTSGSIISFFLGKRMGGQIRSSFGRLLGLFWIAIFLYTVVAAILVYPQRDYRALSMMIITMVMLGYTIMGLFTNVFLSFVGIFITLCGLFSYLFLPRIFDITMAFFGGGTLMVSGIYMLRRWKP